MKTMSLSDYLERSLFFFMTLALVLFWFDFFIDIGNYKTYFYFSCVFSLLIFLLDPKNLRLALPKGVSIIVVVCGGVLLLLALLAESSSMASRKIYVQHIIYFSILFMLTSFWLRQGYSRIYRYGVPWVVGGLFVLGALYQLYGVVMVQPRQGFFWNPHYLAQFCILGLGVVAMIGISSRRSPVAWGSTIVALIFMYLLIKTQSRPAWISLFFSVGLMIFLYVRGKNFWRAWAVLAGIILGAVWLFPDLVAQRFMQLIANISTEERVYIWQDSWKMLAHLDWLDWLVGRGPGSFRQYLPEYIRSEYKVIEFPHNFFLELAFESGVLGVLTLVTMYYSCLRYIHRAIKLHQIHRALLVVLLGLLVAHILFTFLVIPFYSKQSLLIQAPMLALGLYWASSDMKASCSGEAKKSEVGVPVSGDARKYLEP